MPLCSEKEGEEVVARKAAKKTAKRDACYSKVKARYKAGLQHTQAVRSLSVGKSARKTGVTVKKVERKSNGL